MAAYDPQELEQLEDLKAWWTRHGNKIASVIIVAAVAYLGYQGWRWYSAGHSEAASTLYAAVSEGARTDNPAKAKEAMAQLAERYSGTPYAPRAALVHAKTLWDSGDKAGARAQLQWVLDHATDSEILQVTRFRLAETWLDEGKSDEALKLLDTRTDDAFAGIYADLRGDALAAAGRNDDARKAYEIALSKIDARSPYRNYIEVKFQSLGGGSVAAPEIAGFTAPAKAGATASPAPDGFSKDSKTPAPASVPASDTKTSAPASTPAKDAKSSAPASGPANDTKTSAPANAPASGAAKP